MPAWGEYKLPQEVTGCLLSHLGLEKQLTQADFPPERKVHLTFSNLLFMITKVMGTNCVLSNFYPCQITIGRTTYPSAEHYYQYRKAVHHRKISLSRRIMTARTAAKAKEYSDDIRPNSAWDNQRSTLMTSLLQRKFEAVPEFREALLSTRGFIDHPVSDSFWGSGRNGSNEFGLALAQLRNRYQQPSKMTCLVLGHSFISHLDAKIKDPSHPLQFSEPFDQEGKFNYFFFGLRGATLESLLAYVKRVRLLDHYLPTVVILQVGGNDISKETFVESSFQDLMNDFTAHCRTFGCTVIVMGIWKRLKPRYCTVEVYDSRRAALHTLLNRLHVKRSLWFYPSRRLSSTTQYLGRDGVHPSEDGYARFCKELSKALSWCLWRQGSG